MCYEPLSGVQQWGSGACVLVALGEVGWESAVLWLLCCCAAVLLCCCAAVLLILAPASAACLLLLPQIEDEEMDE